MPSTADLTPQAKPNADRKWSDIVSKDPVRSSVYFEEDGDLEIVSSDNVLFRIHAYHMQSVS